MDENDVIRHGANTKMFKHACVPKKYTSLWQLILIFIMYIFLYFRINSILQTKVLKNSLSVDLLLYAHAGGRKHSKTSIVQLLSLHSCVIRRL